MNLLTPHLLRSRLTNKWSVNEGSGASATTPSRTDAVSGPGSTERDYAASARRIAYAPQPALVRARVPPVMTNLGV
jgi:hypothetical protein